MLLFLPFSAVKFAERGSSELFSKLFLIWWSHLFI